MLAQTRKNNLPSVTVNLEKIVGGGQSLATMEDGRKLFVWGGLPGEQVSVQLTKRKSSYAEGVVTEVLKPSKNRVEPKDKTSYLSTSPWQIMDFDAEQAYKDQLILEAFSLHKIILPKKNRIHSNGKQYHYRNKVEFSWYGHTDKDGNEQLDLAFFRRGTKGKIPVEDSALLPPEIVKLALSIRDLLRLRQVVARDLKTLLIRSNQNGECVWQLYVKDESFDTFSNDQANSLPANGGQIIFSNPKSPASVITNRLADYGKTTLADTALGIPFNYTADSFFQINIPVYEQALKDMKQWVSNGAKTTDMYSGVGTIGLTIGGPDAILVEINESAVNEMKNNIKQLGIKATPILAASESALDYISSDRLIIVDPPRAGLHDDVISRLLEKQPKRIIYLSCNPVTQARDVQKLLLKYTIVHNQGYNFFPRTPHIEHLVVLNKKI